MEDQKDCKRTKNPGIRVVGTRIYDSNNGKTCHQCRQKTMDFAASCKVMKRDKQCTIKYCHKCLKNRYGENAEEVALVQDWTCPKCKGICNCSFCMKKRGHLPTGIMVHTAKATGYSSVSELLQVKGPENISRQSPKDIGVSPKKSVVLNTDSGVASPRKPGKENLSDGKYEQEKATSHESAKKSKTKRERLKEIDNENAAMEKISSKKIKVGSKACENDPEKPCVFNKESQLKSKEDIHVKQEKKTYNKSGNPEDVKCTGAKVNGIKSKKKVNTCGTEHRKEDSHENVKLPPGTGSITVSGIELPPEDVGNALQFLEFCSAFGKVLDLRKGQAECVIRELLCGRGRRRQQQSPIIRMSIQLLSLILKDRGEEIPSTDGNYSWWKALGEFVTESEYQLSEFPMECFKKGIHAYEELDTSKKLQLLNFLCDEALCTLELRNWIDSQNSESVEREKEAKGKITAAKEKEKQLKRKLQDEVAKAVIARKGAPLSVAEHEVIVSQIKAKTVEVHAEKLDAISMLSKKRQRSDAVRTDHIVLDDNGCVLWRLKCYTEEPDILLQDIGSEGIASCNEEKWIAFNAEQKPEIEKYISCLRVKRLRAQKR